MVRILLVDEQLHIRQGLQMSLSLEPDFAVVGEASNRAELLRLAEFLRPDVVVMELELPDMTGLIETESLYANGSPWAIIILSIHDDPHTQARALSAGAAAFVSKRESPDILIATIRRVVSSTMSQ